LTERGWGCTLGPFVWHNSYLGWGVWWVSDRVFSYCTYLSRETQTHPQKQKWISASPHLRPKAGQSDACTSLERRCMEQWYRRTDELLQDKNGFLYQLMTSKFSASLPRIFAVVHICLYTILRSRYSRVSLWNCQCIWRLRQDACQTCPIMQNRHLRRRPTQAVFYNKSVHPAVSSLSSSCVEPLNGITSSNMRLDNIVLDADSSGQATDTLQNIFSQHNAKNESCLRYITAKRSWVMDRKLRPWC